ncbi:MAG: CoA pyrophosphatase [Kofleriaceae bacterium]
MSAFVDRLATRLALTTGAPPQDGQRRAAVAVVLHDEPGGARVLLMKRAERKGDPWSGHISLPGGGYEANDPDLLATAIRETQEELTIDVSGARLLGNFPPLAPRSAGPTLIEVTPFVFVTESALEPICGPEALAAFWLPLELAMSGTLDGTFAYEGSPMTFPSWNFEGHVIWGMTWRILGDLITLAG